MARPKTPLTDSAVETEPTKIRRSGDPPTSEDVLVRNYDMEHPYTVHLRIEDHEDESTFEWTYYLKPGEFRSELGVLSPGTYSVSVTTENAGGDRTTCEVSPEYDGTILVETGNHAVAVSDGLF